MLKKNISAILLISFSLILASCNIGKNNEANDRSYNYKVEKSNDQVAQASIAEKRSENSDSNKKKICLDNSNDMTYEITKGSYINKDIKINYPQIKNLSDINKQKIINNIIKNEALKVLNYYSETENGLTLEINYDIKWKGANLLSIQYSGIGNVKGAAHPNNLFYTTNINMSKGTRLRLKDIVNIDENFIRKFKDGEFKPLKSEDSGTIDISDLIKQFSKADSLDNIGTEDQSDIFSYLTKDSLGISVSVSHAAGDHVEFEIKYKDIANNIKAENEVWKDFSHLFSMQGSANK